MQHATDVLWTRVLRNAGIGNFCRRESATLSRLGGALNKNDVVFYASSSERDHPALVEDENHALQ
jgi:hypothetical protein